MQWQKRILSTLTVLGLAAAPALGDDLTGSSTFLCNIGQATACIEQSECFSFAPQDFDIPNFIEVNLDKKILSTTKASGLNRTTPIKNLERADGQIILQGVQNRRAFSILIHESTGLLTAAVARDGVGVSIFGACTPD
jgi:hypothetical protein